jgi:hypothetical protein
MLPDIKVATGEVIKRYYSEARAEYNCYAFNKKPDDHVFPSLEILKNRIVRGRKLSRVPPPEKGEVMLLMKALQQVMNACDASTYEVTACNALFHKILTNTIPDEQGKELLLIRMRNILISQELNINV